MCRDIEISSESLAASRARATSSTSDDCVVATGERAGRRVRRVRSDPAEGIAPHPCALPGAAPPCTLPHGPVPRPRRVGTPLPLRQPPASGRCPPQRLEADRLSFTLKTPWDDGTCRIVLSPTELPRLPGLPPLCYPPKRGPATPAAPWIGVARHRSLLAPRRRELVVPLHKGLQPPLEQ